MKIRLAQIEVRPGRPRENTARMLPLIADARQAGIDIIVFPEMAIPGYLIGDEWERSAFLRECERCGEQVRQAAAGITVIFGNVGLDWKRRNEDGRVRKYNALFVAEDGHFIGPAAGPYPFVIKTLLPNYREFDDSRHFCDLRKLALEEHRELRDLIAPVRSRHALLGCLLCEDAWDMDYAIAPLSVLGESGADLFINISASPFTLNKNHKRNRVFAAHAARLGRPLLYVNHTGIQNNGKTVFTFDGASCVYDSHGGHLECRPAFAEGILTLDIPRGAPWRLPQPLALREDNIGDAADALLYGTRRFMDLCGVERVVVGVSGGVDSAVVAALYRRLLPPENLLVVNLPSRFNSRTTRSLAHQLAGHLECLYAELPIEDSVALTRRQLDGLAVCRADGTHARRLELSDLALENVQARDRSARLLAGLAAAFGGVFTCNANKSELTVGYTTLYGDLGGYLANLADLWKMEVYALAAHLNERLFGRVVIPPGTLALTPSAELSPAQNVDEGKGDPLIYPYHDQLFRCWVERWDRATPEEVLTWYRDGSLEREIGYGGRVGDLFPTPAAFIADLERWWTLYQGMGVAKRIQAPPILAVKKRAFGFDHRESQMGPRYSEPYDALKACLLAPSTAS
ncbi:MAG: NAD(+) synthase [Lentisphaerae bacterium]|nr:NAD(+) synthase [Lentisphaerota bacterium]